MKSRIWFEGNSVGHWEIACAELCGLGHFRMKGFVTVDSPEDYEKWLAEQAAAQAAEQPQAAADAAPGSAGRGARGRAGKPPREEVLEHGRQAAAKFRMPGSTPRRRPSGASTSSRSTTR